MRGTRYVPLAGGAGIGTALPHAFQADGIAALLIAAASDALIGGVVVYVLGPVNG